MSNKDNLIDKREEFEIRQLHNRVRANNDVFLEMYSEIAGFTRRREYEWFPDDCMAADWNDRTSIAIFQSDIEKLRDFVMEVVQEFDIPLQREEIDFETFTDLADVAHTLTVLHKKKMEQQDKTEDKA